MIENRVKLPPSRLQLPARKPLLPPPPETPPTDETISSIAKTAFKAALVTAAATLPLAVGYAYCRSAKQEPSLGQQIAIDTAVQLVNLAVGSAVVGIGSFCVSKTLKLGSFLTEKTYEITTDTDKVFDDISTNIATDLGASKTETNSVPNDSTFVRDNRPLSERVNTHDANRTRLYQNGYFNTEHETSFSWKDQQNMDNPAYRQGIEAGWFKSPLYHSRIGIGSSTIASFGLATLILFGDRFSDRAYWTAGGAFSTIIFANQFVSRQGSGLSIFEKVGDSLFQIAELALTPYQNLQPLIEVGSTASFAYPTQSTKLNRVCLGLASLQSIYNAYQGYTQITSNVIDPDQASNIAKGFFSSILGQGVVLGAYSTLNRPLAMMIGTVVGKVLASQNDPNQKGKIIGNILGSLVTTLAFSLPYLNAGLKKKTKELEDKEIRFRHIGSHISNRRTVASISGRTHMMCDSLPSRDQCSFQLSSMGRRVSTCCSTVATAILTTKR